MPRPAPGRRHRALPKPVLLLGRAQVNPGFSSVPWLLPELRQRGLAIPSSHCRAWKSSRPAELPKKLGDITGSRSGYGVPGLIFWALEAQGQESKLRGLAGTGFDSLLYLVSSELGC